MPSFKTKSQKIVEAGTFGLRSSPVLGERAIDLYKWFVKSLHLTGNVAECGVYRGHTSRQLARYLKEDDINKTVLMFDSFGGFPASITEEEKLQAIKQGQFLCPLEEVLREMEGLSNYRIYKGLFSETFSRISEPLCFIHADADLYSSTIEIIRLADRVLVKNGHIIFDDYGNPDFPGVTLAVDKYLSREDYDIIPLKDIQLVAKKK